MSCSGLHCAGCAGGVAVPVVPLAATLGVAWVVEHIIEVAAVSAGCGALAVVAVVWLMRWQERREAVHAASRPFLVVRGAPAAVYQAVIIPAVPASGDRGVLPLALPFPLLAPGEDARCRTPPEPFSPLPGSP